MKFFALSLATACTLAQAADIAAQRAQERSAIAQQRAAITQQQAHNEAVCHQRFAVEDCLIDVRRQARTALAPLQARELELNQQERQERAAQRLRAIEAKQAHTPPPAPLQTHTRKPAPDAAAVEQQENARAAEAAVRANQQRQRQAAHAQERQTRQAQDAQRGQQAQQEWADKQRRAEERRARAQQQAKPQQGQPLPVPGGVSPPEK